MPFQSFKSNVTEGLVAGSPRYSLMNCAIMFTVLIRRR